MRTRKTPSSSGGSPRSWRPGEDTVVLPFISDAEAERMFGGQGGLRKVRSYLRYVRDPPLRMLPGESPRQLGVPAGEGGPCPARP